MIQVPVSFLLSRDQTAPTKLVWLAQRLNPPAGPAELEAMTGLSRHTILRATRQTQTRNLGAGPRVKLPARLLADRTVGARAKLLYGLLQAVPDLRDQSGRFTYTSLCSQTQLCRNTLKEAIAELEGAGWITTRQANQKAAVEFTLSSPEQQRSQAEVGLAERRLKRLKFAGEALMQEWLTLLIDSDNFTDNARPGFLINPLTGERLELDRFYPPQVAFEFHGTQHDRPTERYTQAQVDAQRLRDLIKAGLCLYAGIQLVIVRAEDLSLQGMIKKIGRHLPLRDLTGHEALIDLLEEKRLVYRAATP
jgi:hypothetical protein